MMPIQISKACGHSTGQVVGAEVGDLSDHLKGIETDAAILTWIPVF
jgi:hypothetical protein